MTKLKERANHFWREMSHQDFLLLIASLTFFTFIAVGLIMLLFGIPIDQMYLELLSMMSPIIISITAGVFSISAVQTFKGEKKETTTEHRPSENPNVNSHVEHIKKDEFY